MQIAKFKIATLTAILILAGINSLHSAKSLSMINYTIFSSGSIGILQTRPLHIEGRYVKDDYGNTVFLRGVDKTGFLDSSTGFWLDADGTANYVGTWDESIVRMNLQGMKDWGIKVIRMMLHVEWWLTNYQGTGGWNVPANKAYRASFKDTIALCQEYGIYVVIAPWCVRSGEGYGQDPLPFPPYTLAPDVITSEQDFVDFWVSVAAEVGGYANVLYDLWNEPAGDATAQEAWFRVVQQVVDAIRAIPDDNIIIVQWGYAWSLDWVDSNQFGENIIYSTHLYDGTITWDAGGYTPVSDSWWIYDSIKTRLTELNYTHVLNDLNLPVWIGEIGCWNAHDPTSEQRQFFENALKILNEWEIGYAVWEWFVCPGRPYGVLTTPIPTPNTAGQILIDAISGNI